MEDLHVLKIVLSFGTLGFVAVLAYLSQKATEKLKDDPNHKPSSLTRVMKTQAKV